MEWILILAVCVAVIVLFVSNNRMRGEVDRLLQENQIQTANLTRLEKLYEALLAGRHAPAPLAPAPSEPLTAPPPPVVAAPAAAPGEAVPSEPRAPTQLPPEPDIEEFRGDIPQPEAAFAAAGADAPPPPPSGPGPKRFEWERFIGVSLPIWVGAVALCVAGYFFVSYAIESGFFTPEFRVIAALLAGLAFIAGAQVVRSRVKSGNPAAIAAALATAGIATLYATAYIASVTYALIPQTVGFVAMVAVTALAIGIAFVFGQVVAIVGLLGGYLTPALFASDAPSALTLFGYLIALHIAMFGMLRVRGWWHLTLPALAGPALWIVLWSEVSSFADQPWPAIVFLILIPIVAAAAASDTWMPDGEPVALAGGTKGWPRRALPLALLLASLGFVVFAHRSGYTLPFWQGLAALAVLTVAAGFVKSTLRLLQLIPLAASALALLTHPVAGFGELMPIIAIFALVFGFGALDQFRRLREPALWAAAIASIALYFFLIALFKLTGWQAALGNRHVWALAALAFAAAMMGLLWRFGPKVEDGPERSRVYASLAGAVTSFASLAVVLELDPTLFPVASAIGVLGLAAVHSRVPVRGLRILAVVYSVIYGILIIGAAGDIAVPGTGLDFVLARSLGKSPWISLVLPGLAFFGAATLFARTPREKGPDPLAEGLDIVSVVVLALGILYVAMPDLLRIEARNVFPATAPLLGPLVALAGIAIYLGRTMTRRALHYSGIALAIGVAVVMLAALIGPIYSFWPLRSMGEGWIVDAALLALGLPSLVYLAIGRFMRGDPLIAIANIGRALSVFSVVVLYSLLLIEIRYGFNPTAMLQNAEMGSAESYTYSVATLVFGIALLVIGVVIQNRGARALSLVFVLAATVKVFLFDAASLEGLWRVLSFLGMGLSFLGISWAYARYVFGLRRGRGTAPPPAAPSQPPDATAPA